SRRLTALPRPSPSPSLGACASTTPAPALAGTRCRLPALTLSPLPSLSPAPRLPGPVPAPPLYLDRALPRPRATATSLSPALALDPSAPCIGVAGACPGPFALVRGLAFDPDPPRPLPLTHAAVPPHRLALSPTRGLPPPPHCLEYIIPTLIFTSHVKHANAIAEYLTRELPEHIDGKEREKAILPMHGAMSAEHNIRAVERLRDGTTQVLVCSDMGALGIDIKRVRRVIVIVDRLTSYRMLCQKLGRIRTEGIAILFFPRGMDEMRHGTQDVKMRSEAEPVMVKFANATGKPVTAADQPCCNRHNPEIDKDDLHEVQERAAASKAEKKHKAFSLRTDGTHRVPDETIMQPIARKAIIQWRRSCLAGYVGYETYLPFSAILPDDLVTLLAQKLHICTTFERFQMVMLGWERLEELGRSLFDLVSQIWVEFESKDFTTKMGEIQARRKKEKDKHPAEKREAGEDEGHVLAPTNIKSRTQARASGLKKEPKAPRSSRGRKKR
ncbi:hypothetical protein FRC06_009382, partial [Ceratobasidium sp. 370]